MQNIGQPEPIRRAPLTSGARVIRGFRRIGAIFAVPILLTGVGISILFGYEAYDLRARKSVQANCLLSKAKESTGLPLISYDRTKVDPQAAGCDGPMYSVYPRDISIYASKPSFIEEFTPAGIGGSAATVAGAAATYALFWAIGWVFAGFTRD